MKRVFWLTFFVALWGHSAIAQPWEQYQSADEPGYKSYNRTSRFVAMSDSTKLAVDVYLPTKGPEREEFPVVFKMTPYGRAYIGPNVGFALRTLSWISGVGWRPLLDQDRYSESISLLLKHGYAVVVADMRGTGASFGSQMPLDPQHADDGEELINWIAKQPFSNGNVGMIGKSYMAWVQFLIAAKQPEALKCIAPEVIFFESFTGSFKPGGITAFRWMNSFSDRLHSLNMNFSNIRKFEIPAAPVIDEDNDGKLEDEWPNIDTTIYRADAKPRYNDHQNRTEHYYWNATRDHLNNIKVRDLMSEDFQYFNSVTSMDGFSGYSYRDVAPGHYYGAVIDSKIPVFHIGRWQDGFVRGTTQLFASAQQNEQHRILLIPGFHMSGGSRAQRNFFGLDYKMDDLLAREHLRFYDQHLKHLSNGIDTLPQVAMFVPQDGWQTYDQWPPKELQDQKFYLSDGKLAPVKPAAGKYAMEVDTLHASNYGKKGLNRWTMASGMPKKPMIRTEIDRHATLFESEPLTEDLLVTGHPIIDVWITANADNADLFVYLEDVDAKGKAYYVTEGQLRASWNGEADLAEQLGVDFEIKPALPWHGYVPSLEEPQVLKSGEPVRMHFDLMPIAWQFKKGHRIRVAIAGLDKGNFEVNPAYYNSDGALRNDVQIYLHQSDYHPSFITIPVVIGEQEEGGGPVISEK